MFWCVASVAMGVICLGMLAFEEGWVPKMPVLMQHFVDTHQWGSQTRVFNPTDFMELRKFLESTLERMMPFMDWNLPKMAVFQIHYRGGVMGKLRLKPDKDGSCYHIMVRTAQAKWWFHEDFRSIIYDRILFFAKVYYLDVYAITCLSNHFHLCLSMRRPEMDRDEVRRRFELLQGFRARPRKWCPTLAKAWHDRFCDLSKLMWDIDRSLSWTFNRKHKTHGHLWGSRFKSILIEEDDSLLKVMSYIELNPVEADMVDDPRDYRFSSVGRLTHPEWGESGITLPAAGFLRFMSPKIRLEKYLLWLRALAIGKRMENTALTTCNPILSWAPDVEEVLKEFDSGALTQWNQQAYGSQEFHDQVQKTLKSYKHELRLSRVQKRARASPQVS
jgi:hypothetical protein